MRKNGFRTSLVRMLAVTAVLTWIAGTPPNAAAGSSSGNAGRHDATGSQQPATVDVDLIHDGGFETGSPNLFWEEHSTQFGTPLCGPASCIGRYPRSGDWWAWFGGTQGLEQAAITQTVRIPTGPAQLHFFVWMEHSPGFVTDTLRMAVDGNVLWSTNGADTAYASGYTEVTIDLAVYANGQPHAISFASRTDDPDKGTNFMLDDVALLWQPPHQVMLPLLLKAP